MFQSAFNNLFNHGSAFAAFLASTDQKQILIQHLCSVIQEIIAREEIRTIWGASPLIVDIGVGEGSLAKQYLDKLRQKFPKLRFVGVDPQEGMIEACREKLYGQAPIKEGDLLIRENFFDHLSQGLPEELKGIQADLVICSHVMYYAHDVPKAIMLFEELRGTRGMVCFANQSSASQMHLLRDKFSYNDQTLRQADGTPNCSDHISASIDELSKEIPQLTYTSHLYFSKHYREHFAFLANLLKDSVPREQWGDQAIAKFQREGAEKCSNSTLVLEFILRERLDTNPANSISFIKAVQKRIDDNSVNFEKPHIVIVESFVFSAPSSVLPLLIPAVRIYKQALGSQDS